MRNVIVLLPGDGIGPEVLAAARLVLETVSSRFSRSFSIESHPIGGVALHAGLPALPAETLAACRRADGVLLGAVGDPALRPPALGRTARRAACSPCARALACYANLRPARIWPGCGTLVRSSPRLRRGPTC